MSDSVLLELDERRRAALGRLGRREDTRYVGTTLPDGTIVLSPAEVVARHEAALMRHPELQTELREAFNPDVEVDDVEFTRSRSRSRRNTPKR